MGEDACEKEPMQVIRPASPKQLIRPETQKKYFQEVVETFAQLGGDKGIELPVKKDTREQSATGALIEEWLNLFLKIVHNTSMREQLKHTLEEVLQGNAVARESLETAPQYV